MQIIINYGICQKMEDILLIFSVEASVWNVIDDNKNGFGYQRVV
jgi:hypothetical protein